MYQHRNRVWFSRTSVLVLAAACGLLAAGAAGASEPFYTTGPSLTLEGTKITAGNGSWSANSGAVEKYVYRFTRDGTTVKGPNEMPKTTQYPSVPPNTYPDVQDANVYALQPADAGRTICVEVWGGVHSMYTYAWGELAYNLWEWGHYDVGGQVEGRAAKACLVAPAPKPATAQASGTPAISGLAMEDEVLRATGVTWSGPGPITTVINWQRCNAAGEGCVTVAGRTGATYQLTAADVGSRLRVIEVATNPGGTAQAVSNTTAVVSELRPSAARPTITGARVVLPNRLLVDRINVTQVGRRVTVKIRVSDARGFRITGILVKATPTGLLSGRQAERATDGTGWATFVYTATGSGATYVFAQAHKKGEAVQRGVSSANLFRIRIR